MLVLGAPLVEGSVDCFGSLLPLGDLLDFPFLSGGAVFFRANLPLDVL